MSDAPIVERIRGVRMETGAHRPFPMDDPARAVLYPEHRGYCSHSVSGLLITWQRSADRASTDSGHDVGLRLRPSRPTGLFGGMLSAPLVMPEVITGLSLLPLSGLGVDRECQIGKLLQRVGQ